MDAHVLCPNVYARWQHSALCLFFTFANVDTATGQGFRSSHCWSWSHLFGVFEHNHFFSDFLIILTKTVIKYFFNVECIVYYIVIAKAFS